jgi:hypothetical protein
MTFHLYILSEYFFLPAELFRFQVVCIHYFRKYPFNRKENLMKYIMRMKIPNPHGNELLRDPQFGTKMKQALDEVKAETAYFTTIDGCRGGFVVVNMNDGSEMAKIAEPFFLWLDAEIDFLPVMTPQDLGKAGPVIEAAAKRWAH